MLSEISIDSEGGFEVALELLVKCWIKGRRITELPTTWTDRTAGQSNFKLIEWLPNYLRWYLLALKFHFRLRRDR